LSEAKHLAGEWEKRPSVGLRSFADPVLERSEGLRVTATVFFFVWVWPTTRNVARYLGQDRP
jgi:hypothetical protein